MKPLTYLIAKAMTPKRQRMWIIIAGLVSLAIAVAIILSTFSDNLVFFYSPSELKEKNIGSQTIRIGGLVKEGSIKKENDSLSIYFVLTDLKQEVAVQYTGLLPNLFRENQGIVAHGHLNPNGVFTADELLAKHDENYMPKEVADALKKSGQWKPEKNAP